MGWTRARVLGQDAVLGARCRRGSGAGVGAASGSKKFYKLLLHAGGQTSYACCQALSKQTTNHIPVAYT
jgi:hypothetical protein